MGYVVAVIFSIIFMIGMLAWGIVPAFFHSAVIFGWPVFTPSTLKLFMAPGFLISAGLCALFNFRVNRRFAPPTGSLKNNAAVYVTLLLLPVLLQLLASPLYDMSLWLFKPNDLYRSLLETLRPTGQPIDTAGAILSIVLIGPVCEEVVFRGFMIERALTERRNLHLVILLQAFLFGLAHMNPWQFFYGVAFGALFGYLRIWSGGILLSTVIHSLVNGWSVAAMYVDIPLISNQDDTAMNLDLKIVAIALILAIAVLYWLYKAYHKDSHSHLNDISSP